MRGAATADGDGTLLIHDHEGHATRSAAPPVMRIVEPLRAFDVTACLRSAGAVTVTYRRSQAIFSQGDAADSIWYIQNGAVKLSVLSRTGREGVIAILESGDFLGESALSGPVRLETATAAVVTTAIVIPKQQMTRLLQADSAFSDRFIAHLLARKGRMEGDLVDQLLSSSEQRLARILLLLAHDSTAGRARRVLPRVSQATLAEMVGTTRPRINLFMRRFRSRGFIEDDNGLKINDSLVTVVLQGESRRSTSVKGRASTAGAR